MDVQFPKQCIVILFLYFLFPNKHESYAQPEENGAPYNPLYTLSLNLSEFSVLNSSIVHGLENFGGLIDFELKVTKDQNQLIWIVTIDDYRLIEVLKYWLSLKSVDILELVDVDSLDHNSKVALKAIKSLSRKIEQATNNPSWRLLTLSGLVMKQDDEIQIVDKRGKYLIKNPQLNSLVDFVGKQLIVHGYEKTKGQIEVTNFFRIKANTLELFVMSLCPYAQKAEKLVIEYIQENPQLDFSNLEVHYIFYKTNNNGSEIEFSSLRGENEVHENLIQIVIRDYYPQYFYPYLLKRAVSKETWDKLLIDVGLTPKDVTFITQKIIEDKKNIILNEFNYTTQKYGIYDGSPTFAWEGQLVENVSIIPAFQDLPSNYSIENCSN